MVMNQPGVRLLDLLNSLHRGQADDVYQLILTDQVYVNLSAVRLTDHERVQVFLKRDGLTHAEDRFPGTCQPAMPALRAARQAEVPDARLPAPR